MSRLKLPWPPRAKYRATALDARFINGHGQCGFLSDDAENSPLTRGGHCSLPGTESSVLALSGILEIELKLYARSRDLPRLEVAIPGIAKLIGKPQTRRLVTDYYEASDLALAKSGIVLRVRHIDNQHVQGLKARASSFGSNAGGIASQREEWEWQISGSSLDLRALNEEGPAHLIPTHALGTLQPLFRTEIQRTSLGVQPTGSVEIEIALDKGMALTERKSVPISEVELELRSPPTSEGEAALYRLGLEILRIAPVTLGGESKADRGYRAAVQLAAVAIKRKSPFLPVGISVEDGLPMIFRGCIDQIVQNQAAALNGDEVNGVHQMRIGVRRLRSALRLFDGYIASAEASWIEAELKWLGSELGGARDWDVFVCRSLEQLAAPRSAVETVKRATKEGRSTAHAAVRKALQSPRYTTLILTLGVWIAEGQWHERLDAKKHPLNLPLAEAGRDLLARLSSNVGKRGRRIAKTDARGRHRLRKAAKKLRYGAEFLAPLYSEKSVRRYLKRLAVLLDRLGSLNDWVAADNLLKELKPPSPHQRATADQLRACITARKKAHGLSSRYRRFARTRAFWT